MEFTIRSCRSISTSCWNQIGSRCSGAAVVGSMWELTRSVIRCIRGIRDRKDEPPLLLQVIFSPFRIKSPQHQRLRLCWIGCGFFPVLTVGKRPVDADVRRFCPLVVVESAGRTNPLKSPLQDTPCCVSCSICGEVTERPKVLAWKAGVPQGTEGSNPSFSAIF